MVQKSSGKRGRPRAYDPDAALARAMAVFWDGGYSATSLDDLSAETGMNRPSLYGAFGDKRALYRQALERYRKMSEAAMQEALVYDKPLREALRRVYDKALSIYLSGEKGARGCYMSGTALTEAVSHPEIRADLAELLHALDGAFEARIRFAREQGELPADAAPAALAALASATLHTLAIRSRAGEKRPALEAIVAGALDLVCGPAAPSPSRPAR
jgi:AcrR family transcriptional regulator